MTMSLLNVAMSKRIIFFLREMEKNCWKKRMKENHIDYAENKLLNLIVYYIYLIYKK